MILQIVNNTIDPSWVLAGLGSIVAFFAVRTLLRVEQRMDKQDKRSDIITRVLLQMLTKLGDDDNFYHGLSDQLNKNE